VISENGSGLDLELNEVYYTTSTSIRLKAGLSCERDIVDSWSNTRSSDFGGE
jgi:hypothetical protein